MLKNSYALDKIMEDEIFLKIVSGVLLQTKQVAMNRRLQMKQNLLTANNLRNQVSGTWNLMLFSNAWIFL